MVLTQGSYKPKTKIGQQYLLAKKNQKFFFKKIDSIFKIIKKKENIGNMPKCVQMPLSHQ